MPINGSLNREDYPIHDQMLILATYALTDGHLKGRPDSPNKRIVYGMSPNRQGLHEVIAALESLRIPYRKEERVSHYGPIHNITILSEDAQPILDIIDRRRDRIPDLFLKLSQRQCMVVLSCWAKSDGQILHDHPHRMQLQWDRGLEDVRHAMAVQVEKLHKYLRAFNEILKERRSAGLLPVYDAGFVTPEKQYLTIGVNGFIEGAESLGIAVDPQNEDYLAYAEAVLQPIHEANRSDRAPGILWNTEMVPAENLGVKNAAWDRSAKLFVPRDCYNSYFFRVEDPKVNVLDKLMLHGRAFTRYLDGGSACHINLEEHLTKAQYLLLMDAAIRTGCSYFTFNVPNTVCRSCGYISKPLRRGDCAAELAGQREHQIDEGAVEGGEILRRIAGAADGGVAMKEERVQGDGSAVGLAHDGRLVMAIDFMLLQLAKVFLRDVRAVHLLELLVHCQPVDGDGVALVQLRLQRGDVLAGHVCVRVHLAAGGGVGGPAVAGNEVLMSAVLLVFVNSHGRSSSFPSATQAQPGSSSFRRPHAAWVDA